MNWELFFIQVLNGFQFGILLFLVSAGLTLVFGIVNFLNLAHGTFYMLGAYICASFTALTSSFMYGILLTMPVMALIGISFEMLVARYLYGRNHLEQVLATFGIMLSFSALVQVLWGTHGMQISLPDWLRGQISVPGIGILPLYRLFVVAIGLSVAVLLHWIVQETKFGKLMRAAASDSNMLAALGVNVRALFTAVFVMGSVLAGLAGIMILPITGATSSMGSDIIIMAFIVIMIGGMGSVKGAFVGAMLIGFVDTMGRAFSDDLFKLFMSEQRAEMLAPTVTAMSIFILTVVVLFCMPRGLFPPQTR